MKILDKSLIEDKKLEGLYNLIYRAHSNTNHMPENRAIQYILEYSEMLEEDLKELGDNCGNYEVKFIDKFTDWMHAKSRCISSMITGPANFPVRRAQKANDSERNKSDHLYQWRAKYFTAVNRVPTKSPEDDLALAERNVEDLTNLQLEYKEINAAIRKEKLDMKGAMDFILKNEYNKDYLRYLEDYDGKVKLPSWLLSNNNASIKRYKDKVTIMQTRIDRKNAWEDIIFEGGRVTIEDDRVKIYHDEKPEREIIQEIKSSGFRWSPNWQAWVRKHTGNAVYTVKRLSFVTNK